MSGTQSASVENLERRILLSYSLNKKNRSFNVDQGATDDVIIVSRSTALNGAQLVVNINGSRFSIDWEKFRRVNISTGAGNDRVILDDTYGQMPTSRPFRIFLGDGNDTISGSMNNEYVEGGEGDDSLLGNRGTDTLDGQGGNDRIFGMADADSLSGGDGNDFIDCGRGADTASGDAGSDVIYGGLGGDSIRGGEGIDFLYGNDGNDTLFGEADNDKMEGGSGNNILTP